MKDILRNKFREDVFTRDNHRCVVCSSPAIDAHHILERRLFSDGGYHIDNGASVCSTCHIECERTNISVEELRTFCKITKPYLPDHFYHDQVYDKWGNICLENDTRLRGELFHDESVQKILSEGKHYNKFVDYVKYPRTYHLPWTENMSKDDRIIDNSVLENIRTFVVTEKMDGENTTIYSDYIHARSVDSSNHVSRNWVKKFASEFQHDIPKGWRIVGENMFAKHSILYTDLETYFYGFSIWDDKNICLSWEDTLHWFELLNITPVKTICNSDEKVLNIEEFVEQKYHEYKNTLNRECEGYVLRSKESFSYKDFNKNVFKYVRKNHIQTVKHWMYGQKIEKNIIRA